MYQRPWYNLSFFLDSVFVQPIDVRYGTIKKDLTVTVKVAIEINPSMV